MSERETMADSKEEEGSRDSDVQPTPPPRKKKLEKLLKKQIEANQLNTPTAAEVKGQEQEPEIETEETKKQRRKHKHSK